MFISIVVGLISIMLFSINLFKKIEYEYLLISLFIIISPVPILAYTNSIFIKYYFYISFIFIFIFSIINLQKINFKFENYIFILKRFFNNINYSVLVYAILLTLFLTYKFFPIFYRFDAHDVLYFSWLNDLFDINYFGPIRVPSAYPFLLSANHLIAGSLLTPFLVFTKNINLFSTYLIKYLIIFYCFINFSYCYLDIFFRKIKIDNFKEKLYPIIILLLLFLFYYSEIDYSLAISNYPLILLGLSLCSLLFKKYDFSSKDGVDSNNKDNLIFIFFICCFLIAKATLFPVFFLSTTLFVFAYGLNKSLNFIFGVYTKYNILIFSIIVINFISWILPESNHGSISFAFPLCLNINQSIDNSVCLNSLFKNPFSGWFIEGFKLNILKIFLVRPFLEYVYIWLICLIPCYVSGILILKNTKFIPFRNFGKYLICYVISSSLAIISIRESISFNGGHTAHSYLVAPIFTIVSLLILYLNYSKVQTRFRVSLFYLILLLVIIFIFSLDDSIVFRRKNNLKISSLTGESGLSLSYYESKKFDKEICTKDESIIKNFGVLLDSNNCGNDDLAEIKYALDGRISSVSLSAEHSIIKKWTIKN